MIQAQVEVIKKKEKNFKFSPKDGLWSVLLVGLTIITVLIKSEKLPEVSEAAIYAVMTRIMLRRLTS
ncbi:MAG: hypothetical protein N5P05_004408 (plasmid) [Chroococcopsis gigantea SAG 12.99]|nr:hypothetical protein [Chroococcopsis gigantea SAG 12.99]